MSRPQGEFRSLLQGAFAAGGPLTVREAAAHSKIGYDTARRTVENMVRAGDLVRCGEVKPERSPAWMGIYEIAELAPQNTALNDLQGIVASWAAFD